MNQKGFSVVLILIGMLFVAGVLIGGAYYIGTLKNSKSQNPVISGSSQPQLTHVSESNSPNTSEPGKRIEFDNDCVPEDIQGNTGVCTDSKQVYLLDITNKKRTLVTNFASKKSNLRLYGDYIAWLDDREQKAANYKTDVFLYNLKTKEEKRLTASPAIRRNLNLSGENIAWLEQDSLSGDNWRNNEIHAYNILSNKEIYSSTIKSTKNGLHLKDNKLIWADSRKGHDTGCENCSDNRFDIYIYDFSTGEERAIVESPYLKANPDLYGDSLVWSDYRNKSGNPLPNGSYLGNSDIYLMNLKNNQEIQLASSKDDEVYPSIWKSKVVWTIRWPCDVVVNGIQKDSTGVYLYDLLSKQTTRLTNYVEPATELFDNLLVIAEGCQSPSQIKAYGIYL